MYYNNFTLVLTLCTNFWVHQKRQTKKENDSSSAFFLSTLISTKAFLYWRERENFCGRFLRGILDFLEWILFSWIEVTSTLFSRMRNVNSTAVNIYDCATYMSRTFSNGVVCGVNDYYLLSMTFDFLNLRTAQWIQNWDIVMYFTQHLFQF